VNLARYGAFPQLRRKLARLTVLGSLVLSGRAAGSELKSDETFVLYPALAKLSKEETHWEFTVRGNVFEQERSTITLGVFAKMLGLAGIHLTPIETAAFNERARLFLADHERGKVVGLRALGHPFASKRSGSDGNFVAACRLAVAEVGIARSIRVEGDPGRGPPAVAAEIFLLPSTGLSVVSDIDDTIKISEVTNQHALVRNTFLRPFAPVPGMAKLYRSWAMDNDAQFHYVSASPWQLYPLLAEFIRSNGFPAGTFHLKEFRVKDRSFLSLFSSPVDYKLGVIEPLLREFPQRRFVLVGDSGERDPEIYSYLARKYPKQIARLFIRNVSEESGDSPRYRLAFRDLNPGLWRVFRDPAELPEKIKVQAQ
jgi:hypothetical protein